MRLRAWAWLALASLALKPLRAETRPRYGGALTVEAPGFPVSVFETLVRWNRATIEPLLAVAWQHDPDYKRWRFSLRSKVKFHDGEPFTAASAVPSLGAALKATYPDVAIEAGGQALVIKSSQPMPDLLDLLAQAAISRNDIGTGAFRIAARDPQHTTFAAFEDYWGGRPYLDNVTLADAAGAHGRADMFDLPVGPQRRIVPEGWTTWSSVPKTLLAIEGARADPSVLKALALAIDRAPIANVLAQHKAEPAFGLLPQWLSGYEFLFESVPDVARAKQMIAQSHPAPVTMDLPNDPFLRSVAERIALNARDAGMAIQFKPSGDLRLVELPVETTDPASALALMKLGDRPEVDLTKPEAVYQFERMLIESRHIIPLLHLRKSYAISPKVHFQPSHDQFELHLEDAWIEP
ncbi:MAG TPA: ABC transporter substrate-binding protein [Bryobacteraceae bacterium]|nr:ABC transporter substrate-binding protein [Bryobacteraceae bacterium]